MHLLQFQGAVPGSDKGLEAGNMDDKEGLVQDSDQGGRRGFVIEVCIIPSTKGCGTLSMGKVPISK